MNLHGVSFILIGMLGLLVSFAFGQLRRAFGYMRDYSNRLHKLESEHNKLLLTLRTAQDLSDNGATKEQADDFLRRSLHDLTVEIDREYSKALKAAFSTMPARRGS